MRRLLLALLLVATTHAAQARSEKALAYPRDAAWGTSLRFLRVDEGLKVLEKDPDGGYLLFELKQDGKTFRGSLEVIEVVRDGRKVVRFILQIQDRPEYVEIAMLTRLEQKLRAELGSPTPPPTKKEEPKPDAPKKDAPPPTRDDGPPVSNTP